MNPKEKKKEQMQEGAFGLECIKKIKKIKKADLTIKLE